MTNLQTFQVFPNIPKNISFLETLSRNIWWCWDRDALELYRRISPRIWDLSGRNPIVFLTMLSQERLEDLAKDNSIIAHINRVKKKFEKQIMPVEHEATGYCPNGSVAYFSMEFGIHESLPLFAGGLGILAGDHLKAASDLGLPLVGIGLLYRQGYFHQYLNQNGWQQETYPDNDLYKMPVERTKDAQGNELRISVDTPSGNLIATVWELAVGRITLYLLDTNVPENSQEFRDITARLYAGDSKTRLLQELLLGVGGMRALKAKNITPTVCHMNEGHCTFVGIERLVQLMEQYKLDINTAKEIIARTTVFTTHTPVPAGHDEFSVELIKPYLSYFQSKLGVATDEILAWGQLKGPSQTEPVSMFLLGIRFAQYCNGVSKLHGEVARKMWVHIWPEISEEEIPITHVTNGVHMPSWISHEIALLFERYLDPEWFLHTANPNIINRIDNIYEEELWRSHEMNRSRLIRTCRKQMIKQYTRRNASKETMKHVETVLDQDILTIGFARRFATYKRANLLFKDPERLESIINSADFPVQFIFAGKAHPKDSEGKKLIENLVHFARISKARHRIVFLEDYDIHIARHLVHGSDIWLNTPRRPMEACGTSGMKAAANGVLNLSVLDGWWCEGYAEGRGWQIGNGEEHDDQIYQDNLESQALYNILENEVIPCFYDRQNGDVPTRWIKMMKESMKMAVMNFCALRMVKEYEDRFYIPISHKFHHLISHNAKEARGLYKQHSRLKKIWNEITLEMPVLSSGGPFRVGHKFSATCKVYLSKFDPSEIDIQLCYGGLKAVDTFSESNSESMKVKENLGEGYYLYECKVPCPISGRFGFTVRAMPHGDDWIKYTPGLITWA